MLRKRLCLEGGSKRKAEQAIFVDSWWQICHHESWLAVREAFSWIKAAKKDFEDFPAGARDTLLDALTAVAEGQHPTIATPLTGLGSGALELASRRRGDAFRVVYALQIEGRNLGDPCLSEKSQIWNRNPEGGNRPDPGPTQTLEGYATMIDGFEVVRGSGNVFRDFGYPDADIRQAKTRLLAAEIMKMLDERQWSIRKAEQETGVNHADFARIRSANIGRFSIERLMTILGALGQEVELNVKVRPRLPGGALGAHA